MGSCHSGPINCTRCGRTLWCVATPSCVVGGTCHARNVELPESVFSTVAPSETIVVIGELAGGRDCVSTPSDVAAPLDVVELACERDCPSTPSGAGIVPSCMG